MYAHGPLLDDMQEQDTAVLLLQNFQENMQFSQDGSSQIKKRMGGWDEVYPCSMRRDEYRTNPFMQLKYHSVFRVCGVYSFS